MDVSASPYCVLAEAGDARFASIPEPASSRTEYATLAASLTNGSAVGAPSTHVHLPN